MHHQMIKRIDGLSKNLVQLATFIGKNPELNFEEVKAQKALTDFLKKQGFKVQLGVGGVKTSFLATYRIGNAGPKIGFLAEYDALPGMGHACGHNLIGPMSCGAAVALSKTLKYPATISVVGCPAEEGGGGKVLLAKAGVFDAFDCAMMVHPDCKTEVIKNMLSLIELDIEFFGRQSHAAAEPEKGINALTAAVQTYTQVLKMSLHLKKDARVHAIFPHAGTKPNIIPEFASLKYYIRALDMSYAKLIVTKVKDIAKKEAKKIGANIGFRLNPLMYEPFHPNITLAKTFERQLKVLNIPNEQSDPKERIGSSDVGNVSSLVPTIHPSLKISNQYFCHTPNFAKAVLSKEGFKGLVQGAKALALTGYEICQNPKLLQKIKQEFKRKHGK
ncbi:MAG: hypothetical protein A3B70_07770 [Deltaproteobacteria bacterium RIFCSPHIGHO2_02_FULL_40_11]|nr:MAG: hypothetical protein A3B70_07770 [Deltaproteobacteria bacterium RIFCSPHIGHO2_02_FULL_40_11]